MKETVIVDATQRVRAMLSFVQAADHGSFAAAARVLGVSSAAVSKNVAGLEAALGVRLMNRSTRSLQLTVEGTAFLERAREAIAALDAAVETVTRPHAAPAGRVRISTSHGFGRHHLVPLLPKFSLRYPEIRLEIDFDDRRVDLIREGYDLGLRGGVIPNSSLISRHICRLYPILVASPDYLAKFGIPASPDDLASHRLITVRFLNGHSPAWRFRHKEGLIEEQFPIGTLVLSNPEVAMSAACSGLGIAQTTLHHAWPFLRRGELKILLGDYHEHSGPETVLQYPHRALLAQRVRATIDFLLEGFAADEVLQSNAATIAAFMA